MMQRTTTAVDRQRGMTLIEMLVASALLLIVVMGMVPLFARSIRTNESAEETSDLVRAAQFQMESLMRLPFDAPEVTVEDGDHESSTSYVEPARAYKLAAEDYVDPATVRNAAVRSQLTIRHFNIAALDDGVLDEEDALDSSANPSLVHFKQIVMTVTRSDHLFGLPIGSSEIQMLRAN